MDISMMTPLEKSEILFKLNPSWQMNAVRFDKELYRLEVVESNDRMWFLDGDTNLFTADGNGDPHFMPLAWRILNWSHECKAGVKYHPLSEQSEPFDYPIAHAIYDFFYEYLDVAKMPPDKAQAAWLDKILELAIEAGIATTN